MRIGLHQSARLEQRLIQSPQMIQAMQILQLPSLDLLERIETELTENPFLEVAEQEAPENASEKNEDPREAQEAETHASDGLEGMLDVLERYEKDFGDGRTRIRAQPEDGDRKYEAMKNAPAEPESLPDAVLGQIALLEAEAEDRQVLEYLVWSLDEHGYLHQERDELAAELTRQLNREISVDEIEVALRRLRRMTHPALGARDLREALLLQWDAGKEDLPLVRTILSDHLPDIEANRLPRIAKATGRPMEEVKHAITLIRRLDPRPGAEYGGRTANTIRPEVIVEELDGAYVVRLDRERSMDLVISPAYRRLLSQAGEDEKVRAWVKKRLESARWFIDALYQRQGTLERIANSIFKRQKDFLDRGVAGLHPMRMQEVADEVGVHISTISRGVSGKYAQTPRGIFPLKFFFTGGTTKSTGEETSRVSIQERLRELVDGESKTQPLSDDQLAEKLAEIDGIKIARRTVSKYRRALKIPASSRRREY